MNDDDLLRRYAGKSGTPQPDGEGEVDDFQSFGWLRGGRERAVMLELRKQSGNIEAIGYAWLQKIDFDPSKGITLWFPGQTIKLIGRHLNAEIRPNIRLFEGLLRHRVSWVKEAHQSDRFETDSITTIIERIE